MSDPTLAVVYAALILHDGEAEVSAENMKKLVTAAKVKGVEPYWYAKFESMLATQDISELLTNISAGGAAPAGGAVASAVAGPAAAAAKEEEPEPEEEEEEATGGGLFDDEDW